MARWLLGGEQLNPSSLMLSTFEAHTRVTPAPASPIVAGPKRDTRLRLPCGALFAIAAMSVAGIGLALWLRRVPAGNPDPRLAFNVFYCLFARNEIAGLAVVAVFSAISAVALWRVKITEHTASGPQLPRWLMPAIVLFCFALTLLGTDFVLHNYALTADEYLADFQARIFMRGRITAEVPAQYLDAVRVIKPTYVDYFPATHSWKATYLPVYAAIRAVFQLVGLQSVLNPLLAAITLLALYATVRNVWPESPGDALLAVALLASSSQFLLMSMTAYAMPAHLAFNAVWLWLYSRPDRPSFYLAPLVGALAIGLHQPIVHALFVLPFLTRLVWQRRWMNAGIYAAIYLVACVGWYAWKMHFVPPASGGGNTSILRLVNSRMMVIQPMNLLLIIGWASLASPLLAALGLGRFFQAKPIVQDAVFSCLLTFGFYYFFYLDQAHGWGYRYFYGVLGCFVLAAIHGWHHLKKLAGEAVAGSFVVTAIVVSFLVQLPLRCAQAEAFVRPFARSAALIHAMPTDVVALDARQAWYSADLIRNDPFLENRPLVVSIFGLTPPAIDALSKIGTVHFFTCDELTKLGMFTAQPNEYGRDPFQLGRGK